MTTLTLNYLPINKKANLLSFPKINWKAYCLCSFLVILSLAVFYVSQINYMIKGSYLIQGYQKQIDVLLQENKVLEVDFSKMSFMGIIGEKTEEMNFEKVKAVKYMQILEASAFLPESGKNNN
ncbi:MAG: hypothetical protein HY005_01800 [Candidatus Staskawiczbacteria bacterium]|nr:hypothetical protein [Candidatus Staskawiczbacteria bacterium]